MRKYIKYYFALLLLAIFGCLEPEDLMTENAKTGGLLNASSLALNYIVGNPGPYELEFLVNQGGGDNPIEEVRLYKMFADIQTGTKMEDGEEVEFDTTIFSNEVLDRTLAIATTTNHFTATDYMFDELIADLEVAAWDDASTLTPLSANDGDYTIGDKWVFRIETVLADGTVIQQGYRISATVSTRYAGKYKCLDGEYWRNDEFFYTESDWPTETVLESVDAITYRVLTYVGPFENSTAPPEWFFTVEGGVIAYPPTTPDGVAQTLNGLGLVTCATNPGDFSHIPCDPALTNLVINDDVNGKDQLKMSFGYYNPGGAVPGYRKFYQQMEKIVE